MMCEDTDSTLTVLLLCSMMQKMGWQGGALGKTNEGIVEPVTPDPQYVSTFHWSN